MCTGHAKSRNISGLQNGREMESILSGFSKRGQPQQYAGPELRLIRASIETVDSTATRDTHKANYSANPEVLQWTRISCREGHSKILNHSSLFLPLSGKLVCSSNTDPHRDTSHSVMCGEPFQRGHMSCPRHAMSRRLAIVHLCR